MTYENVLALRLALESGMRIDDVLSLRSENLKGRTITYIAEKTGKKDSKVISKALSNNLRKQIISDDPKEFFFKHRLKKGEHRTRQAVWKNIKKACVLAGIEGNISPHSARKTYAVEKFKNDGLTETQKALQHDNVNTTMLYAFSDLLSKQDSNKTVSIDDINTFAELIADKVVEKLYPHFK